ncbi:MAG TPA: hypothetical protein VLV18_11365 [Terriglobales bacterium]|nr:hypothetical protein [Terriglobales bacterium]
MAQVNQERNLDWRDYIALTVATFQTVLLPFLVTIAIFSLLLFIIKH